MNWQLAEAKSKFSEVVRLALSEGPQRITRRGDAVVLLSEAEYDRMRGTQQSFIEFLVAGPGTTIDALELPDRSLDTERPNPFDDSL